MVFHEKCGLFGIFSAESNDVARTVYYGLWSLQHRGQEGSGIVSTNGRKMFCKKGRGLVAHVYSEDDFHVLRGNIAIGHNRYATFGKSTLDHTQPVYQQEFNLALAHNGNLPNVSKMQTLLKKQGIAVTGLNDSELMYKTIQQFIVKGASVFEAVQKSFDYFIGAFCLLIMTKNELIAVRDQCGIRPLSLGKFNGTHVVASETCALDAIGAEYVRDIDPGEMLVINKKGLFTYKLAEPRPSLDVFELIYFARPDSMLIGQSVYQVRERLGMQLAEEANVRADMVIPVPDSAIPSAVGYSRASGIKFEQALVKNRYIHRTFIEPAQKQRDIGVRMKLNVIRSLVAGKCVVLIDDSIVRGTTSKRLVALLKDAGADKVHLLIPAPPVFYPDFYGINTPRQSELIATHKNLRQITEFVGANSVSFLSYEGMLKAIGVAEKNLCTSCFSGVYPIPIGPQAKKIKQVKLSGFLG